MCSAPNDVCLCLRLSRKRPKQDIPYSAEDGIFRHMKIVEYSDKNGIMWNLRSYDPCYNGSGMYAHSQTQSVPRLVNYFKRANLS